MYRGPWLSSTYTPYPADIPPYPQVGVLDYDRTLVSVENSFEAILEAASQSGIDPAQLRQARARTEKTGDSFYTQQYIEATWGSEAAVAVTNAFTNKGVKSQYYPDADRFLGRLNSNQMPHFVMSRSTDYEGQYDKLLSSPYGGGLMLVPDDDKGRYQRTFQYPDGYRLHRVGLPLGAYCVAETACLVDDSFATFRNWQGPGYYLLRGRELEEELPDNVTPIQTFDDLDIVDGRIVLADPSRVDLDVEENIYSAVIIPMLDRNNPDSQVVWAGEAA